MRIICLAILLSCHFSICADALAKGGGTGTGGPTSVRGYVKKDGTYVPPHNRSAPDGNFNNNWTTKGNTNPYTGEEGTKNNPPVPSTAIPLSTYSAPAPTAPMLQPSFPTPDVAEPIPLPAKIQTSELGTAAPKTSLPQTTVPRALTYDEIQSLELACIVAKSQGPATYKACLSEQRAALGQVPSHPNFSGLGYEERQSLELACIIAKTNGPATYNRCLTGQLQQLASSPPQHPNISSLVSAERQSLELACIVAKSSGPAAYNGCLSEQIQRLSHSLRYPNLGGLSQDERQSIELACIVAKSDGPASYNGCLHEQLSQLNGR